jgi:hypothetical protein
MGCLGWWWLGMFWFIGFVIPWILMVEFDATQDSTHV